MDDPNFYMNAISVALGGGAGGVTAWAVLHTRLSAAEKTLDNLETAREALANALGAKHEANATRIAQLEAGGPIDCGPAIAEALDAERIAIRDLVEARRAAA